MAYVRNPYKWTDRSMHFHAKWRTADMKTRPFHDWTYCDLKGKGVFVGDMLSVMNPVGGWWGEGDEKIFVDGEKFPSWFGTGSEDYYGYAWSDPTPFQHPYHNQTRCDGKGTGATFGHTSVNRFHILDAIPFEKSFRFDMECWHWDPNVTVNYAATSYWYARPGATDDFEPVDAKVLQNIPSPPPPFKIEGALEGESLKVLGKSSDFPLGRAGHAGVRGEQMERRRPALGAAAEGRRVGRPGTARGRPTASISRRLSDEGARLRRGAVLLGRQAAGQADRLFRAGEGGGHRGRSTSARRN